MDLDEEREAFLDEHEKRIQKIDQTLEELGHLVGDEEDDAADRCHCGTLRACRAE